MNFSRYTEALYKPVPALSLAFFRIVFGILMFSGLIRFWVKGWIYEFYSKPTFFFTYYGFEWVKPFPENGMYILFFLLILLAIFITLGFLYRISIGLFFIGFTYVELIDKTNYLNHYYFISLLSFLMIFMPMHCCYSIDSILSNKTFRPTVPQWTIRSLQLQVGIVYFFGGIAKLKYDWLFRSEPVSLWLSPHTDYFLIGPLMDEKWFAFFVSWLAAIFDLTVSFFLLKRQTRNYAFASIILFHILTWKLFQIGMFPWMMIFLVLIYYPYSLHQKIIDKTFHFLKRNNRSAKYLRPEKSTNRYIASPAFLVIVVFFIVQFLLPFRYLLYPGNVCWTEEGFRFSWNIMLVEKKGHTEFMVRDPSTNKRWSVSNRAYLTAQQDLMMSTQPDMILQFAHYIKSKEEERGIINPEIHVKSFVSLNGRPACTYIDPAVNLAKEVETLGNKKWILPCCCK